MDQANIFRDRDLENFAAMCKRKGLDHIEEVTLHISQAWATTDVASGAGAPYVKNILDGTSANLVERTQDPPLGLGNKLPGDSLICIGAIGAVVRLGDYGTTLQKKSTQLDLDRGVISMTIGGQRAFEVYGPEFQDYGPSMLVGNDGTTAPGVPGFNPTGPRRVRRLEMARILGTEQTFVLQHSVARATAWGVAFTADYFLPSLIGRQR